MESPLRIGWIGTGVMGNSMAGHLLAAGHSLTIHSRTKSRAAGLLSRGANWAQTPVEAASGMDFLFSMVALPSDVESVHLGPHGTLSAPSVPKFLVDMTSSRPSIARKIAQIASEKGSFAFDAPVTGGDIGARNATLSILVGGDASAFEQVLPVLKIMGKTVVLQGDAGCGQQAKVVNQILIASTMMGICEALLYARESGLDPERVLESVSAGAAGSWSLANLAPRILKGDFEPGFFIDHFLKDLGIALEECHANNLHVPGLMLAESLYRKAQEANHGRKGTQALYLHYASRKGSKHS